MTTGPIVIHQSELVLIHAYSDKFVAVVMDAVGSFTIKRKIERVFPHAEDLFALSVHGLLKLVKEFHDEVIQTISN